MQSPAATLIVFLLLYLACCVDRFIFGALLSPIKVEFGFGDEQLGRMMFAFTIANVAVMPLFGFLGDRFSRKGFILAGLLLWSLATAGSGMAYGLGSLIAWRVMVGIGEGAYQTLAPGWLADVFPPHRRDLVFGLYNAVGSLGAMVGLAGGGWLTAHYGWRSAFLLVGLPGLVLAGALYLLREPARGESERHVEALPRPSWDEMRKLFIRPDYHLFLLAATASLFGLVSVTFWGPAYLHRQFGISNQEATTFFGFVYLIAGGLGTIGGGLAGGHLQQRLRNGYALLLAGISSIAGITLVLALLADDLWFAKLAFAVQTLFATACLGVHQALLFRLVPAPLRGTGFATFMMTSGLISAFLQAEVLGYVSDHAGLRMALFLVPAGYLLSLLIWVVLAVYQLRQSFTKVSDIDLLDAR